MPETTSFRMLLEVTRAARQAARHCFSKPLQSAVKTSKSGASSARQKPVQAAVARVAATSDRLALLRPVDFRFEEVGKDRQ